MTVSTAVATRTASVPDKLAYARALADSGLLPAQYRKQPANVLYAVEYGDMLGLAPMAAITGIHVIEGKPSASAALISALVRRAGHRIRTWGDDQKAITEIVRSDDPEFVYRVEWTLARARTAELLGKGTWKKYPAALLKARSVTECARDACQEVLFGLQYTPEELGADTDEDGQPIIVVGTVTRTDQAPPPTAVEHADDDQSGPAGTADAAVDELGPEPDWDELIAEAERTGSITAAWKLAREHRPGDMQLRERIQAAGQTSRRTKRAPVDEPVEAEIVDEPAVPGPVTERHNAHMHVMWGKAGVSREERLAVTSHLLGREITTSKDLTDPDAEIIIERLRAFDSAGKDALRDAVDRWLEQWATAQAASADAAGRP